MPLPAYALLGAAILAEVIGTSALKASEGFTRPLPSAPSVTRCVEPKGPFSCTGFSLAH